MLNHDKLMECIENMETWNLVQLWNWYVEHDNRSDDRVYAMCELDDVESLPTNWQDFMRAIDTFKGFDFNAPYFYYDSVYGITSGCDNIEPSEIADYIMRDGDIPCDFWEELGDAYEEDEDDEM